MRKSLAPSSISLANSSSSSPNGGPKPLPFKPVTQVRPPTARLGTMASIMPSSSASSSSSSSSSLSSPTASASSKHVISKNPSSEAQTPPEQDASQSSQSSQTPQSQPSLKSPPQKAPSSFRDPVLATTPRTPNVVEHSEPQYFTVVWRTITTKKHKNWNGDAVLILNDRTCQLKDMDGKDFGRPTTLVKSIVDRLLGEDVIALGGKEVQIVGTLSKEFFETGKCFLAQTTKSVSSVPTPMKKIEAKSLPRVIKPQVLSGPKYDPTAPNALVMPRPSDHYLKVNNKSKVPVIDVVVDPYLSNVMRPHQREGVNFLYTAVMGMRSEFDGEGAILADEMGLGKSLQTIALIWTLLKQSPFSGSVIKRAMVICPASIVKNWQKEFKTWLGDERIKTFAVMQDSVIEDFTMSNLYSVLIISYEKFLKFHAAILGAKIDLVVCDEGHRLKNEAIKASQSLQALPTRKRVILTGTPIQNDLGEFFAMANFVNPGYLGTYASFKRVFEKPILESRDKSTCAEKVQLGKMRSLELSDRMTKFVLRRTQELNEKHLPPKVELVLFCPPSPLQTKIYKKILASNVLRICLNGSGSKQPLQLLCIIALRQLCNSPRLSYATSVNKTEVDEELKGGGEEVVSMSETLYSDIKNVFPAGFAAQPFDPDLSGKLRVLLNLLFDIQKAKEKVVLVSNFTQALDLFEEMCKIHDFKFLRLDGSTHLSKRQSLVDQFNSKHSPEFIFLLSSKSGGTGLNLIGASRIVLYDIDWNPATDLQAMSRIWRDGQAKRVIIYRLLTSGTIEEKIYQRQISKQSLSDSVMDVQESKKQFSLEELKDIFTLHEDTECNTHDLLECDCCQDGAAVEKGGKNKKGIVLKSLPPKAMKMQIGKLREWTHVTPTNVSKVSARDYQAALSESFAAGASFAFQRVRHARDALPEDQAPKAEIKNSTSVDPEPMTETEAETTGSELGDENPEEEAGGDDDDDDGARDEAPRPRKKRKVSIREEDEDDEDDEDYFEELEGEDLDAMEAENALEIEGFSE